MFGKRKLTDQRGGVLRPLIGAFLLGFSLAFSLASPSSAEAQPTRCQVLEHAQDWVNKRIMYSQGPYGGYCGGGPLYCDPLAGGTCYRADCSGFVSAVWQLPGPGLTTYSFAGGPWNDGSSYIIPFDDLRPGDAINFAGNPNTGTGHIRIFGGWSNAQKTRLWGYETSTCGTPAYRYERDRSEFGSYVAIRRVGIKECEDPQPETPSSLTSNGTISAVNWAGNQHSEVWVRGQNGALHHAWTHAGANWSALHSTGAEASCGFAATHWPTDPDYIETFFPRSSGDSGHLWFNSEWQGPGNFGGAGFKEFSTLLWPNGHNEVFALAPDGAIHHRFWLAGDHAWSDWYNFSGGITFKTGASPIVWGDGRPEVFATDADGYVWSRWWRPDENAWSDWTRSFGDAKMASRPVPVRWQSGRLEIFAQGVDGYLYHSWFLDHQWANLQRLGDRKIQGEPSAIFNPSGNGGPFGPQVFARDENNRLFEIHMENGAWVEFRALLADRPLASEPFAWVRRDGVAMLFAVDANGDLIESHRDKTQGWQPWSVIGGAKVDDCSAPDEPPPGDSGPGDDPDDDPSDDPGAGSGNDPGDDPEDDPGAGSGDDLGAGSGDDPDDELDPEEKDNTWGAGDRWGGGDAGGSSNYGGAEADDSDLSVGCNAAPGGEAGWFALALLGLALRSRRVRQL